MILTVSSVMQIWRVWPCKLSLWPTLINDILSSWKNISLSQCWSWSPIEGRNFSSEYFKHFNIWPTFTQSQTCLVALSRQIHRLFAVPCLSCELQILETSDKYSYLQLERLVNDHLLQTTATTFWAWKFNDFLLFLTSCKRPLDAFSDLYVRCVHCAT